MSRSKLIVINCINFRRFAWLLSFVLLSVAGSFANAEILCTINSEKFSGFKEGLVFSGAVSIPKKKKGVENRAEVFSNPHYAFYLTPGRSLKTIDETILVDFYAEIHHLDSGLVLRSRSGEVQGFQASQIELLNNSKGTAGGKVTLSCKLYED